MKTNLFTLATPVGTFWIQPQPAGRVQLGIDRTKLRIYSSPTSAARDVYEQSTGYEPWDTLTAVRRPTSLKGWARPAATRRPRS